MKKLIQVSILFVLALALIVGLLQIGGDVPQAAKSCRVGWNGRPAHCLVLAPMPGIQPKPQVGWNG